MPPNGIPSYRAPFMSTNHMVSAGHYLSAAAGHRILEDGGNAIDAGVAAGIALNVLVSEQTSFGGVAPILTYRADKREMKSISGIGRWPKATNLEDYVKQYGGDMPKGISRTVTPGACDAWMTALEIHGTMTFEQVVSPARELAANGFPCSVRMNRMIEQQKGFMGQFPSTVEVFMPNGRIPKAGEVFVQKDLASTFQKLVDVERASSHKGREGAIRAARDFFYKGELAEQMARFCQEQGGILTMEDMAEFNVGVEEPDSGNYKGYTFYSGGPWCQGPTLIEVMKILEGFDLQAMGLNSTQHLHTVIESIKLAFSDRHEYFGDPDFIEVPLAGLLSDGYAEERRRALDPNKACPEMPPPGDPWPFEGKVRSRKPVAAAVRQGRREVDTSYCAVVDRWGNAFSAATSDGPHMTPIVPGTGIVVSPRGAQNWLDPDHPACIGPGRRPRMTPQASIVFKDGELFMPFGTPGEDMQIQAMTQFFVNMAEFGLDPQQACEEPRVRTDSFPTSYHPHNYWPGKVVLEGRIDKSSGDGLAKLGHDVNWATDWTIDMGAMSAVVVDKERGILIGGADPRRANYVAGW